MLPVMARDSWEALQRNLTTTEGRLGMTFTADGKCPR